jgi:hypothetical protein
MSNFNEANDLASQLCWGRSYMGDVPMKLDRIVLRKTREFREEVIITVPDEAVPMKHDTWAKLRHASTASCWTASYRRTKAVWRKVA